MGPCKEVNLTGFERDEVELDTSVAGPTARHLHVILIAIVFRLVGAVDLDTDVVGLLLRQGGQTDAQMVEMQPRHLFVEQLRQHVDLFLVLAGVVVQRDLGEQQQLRRWLSSQPACQWFGASRSA